jgi:hypothetical protein
VIPSLAAFSEACEELESSMGWELRARGWVEGGVDVQHQQLQRQLRVEQVERGQRSDRKPLRQYCKYSER